MAWVICMPIGFIVFMIVDMCVPDTPAELFDRIETPALMRGQLRVALAALDATLLDDPPDHERVLTAATRLRELANAAPGWERTLVQPVLDALGAEAATAADLRSVREPLQQALQDVAELR